MPSRLNPYVVLAIGVIAVATSSIFIRLAQGEAIPSFVIAAGRLSVASLVITPWVLRHHWGEIQRLKRRDLALCALGGLILGLHFAAWITSLEYTSVVASVVLVTTNPLFVALLSYPILGEKVGRMVIIGIVVAFLGGGVVAISGDAGDPPTRAAPLLGNALAVVGAIAAAFYFLVGRNLRGKLSLLPYIWLVYGSAALVMLFVALADGQALTGYSRAGYFWLLALGLFPQLVGHSSFNYALGYLPAAFVSLIVLGEPIGSGILAFLFLNETPSALALAGAFLILIGIGIASQKDPSLAERPSRMIRLGRKKM